MVPRYDTRAFTLPWCRDTHGTHGQVDERAAAVEASLAAAGEAHRRAIERLGADLGRSLAAMTDRRLVELRQMQMQEGSARPHLTEGGGGGGGGAVPAVVGGADATAPSGEWLAGRRVGRLGGGVR